MRQRRGAGMSTQPEPVVRRHADHDPSLTCRPALGYGLCEVLGDEGGGEVLSYRQLIKQAAEFASILPPRRTLHCHSSVTVALKLADPEPPSFMNLGRIGELCGIDVYEEPEMMPGAWEIREGDRVVSFGVLRSQP
jgi:hypothetical protein